jgi:gliding motility-associated-like protein
VTNLLAGGNPGMVLHTGPACAGTSHGAAGGAPGIPIFNFPLPVAPVLPNLGPNTSICPGQSISLQTSTSFNSYVWNNGQTTASITVNAPGVYWVDVPSGCTTVRDSIVIGLHNFPFSIGPDLTICQGDVANVIATGQFSSVTWSNGSTSNSIQVAGPGIYSATAVSSNGCVAQDTMLVSQNPSVFSAFSDSVCLGYNYSFNGQQLNQAGVYVDTLQNVLGCDSIVTLQLSIVQPLSSNISASICSGDTYLFNGQSVTNAGQYSVTMPSSFGCDSTVQLTLSLNPLPIVNVEDTLVCSGTNLTLFASGAQSYVWNVPQNPNGSITVAPVQTTAYEVYGIDALGCISPIQTLTVAIDPTPLPNFYMDPDQVEIDDPTITIFNVTTGNNQSTWTILGNSFVNNQSSFDYQLPFQEGNYTVQLLSETAIGCRDSLTLSASVQDNISLYVPNCFTPDVEEYNNTFLPVFSTGFEPKNYALVVLNRWGEVVFESYDYAIGWDGRMNYLLCPDGMYTYRISYQRKEGETPIVVLGHVNLLH